MIVEKPGHGDVANVLHTKVQINLLQNRVVGEIDHFLVLHLPPQNLPVVHPVENER